MKKQEIKVLASDKFVLRRHVTNMDTNNTFVALSAPVEGVLQASVHTSLAFDSGVNLPQNYRYAYVVKFGHLAD